MRVITQVLPLCALKSLSQNLSRTKDACVAIEQLPSAARVSGKNKYGVRTYVHTLSREWVFTEREESSVFFVVAGDKEVIQWAPRPATRQTPSPPSQKESRTNQRPLAPTGSKVVQLGHHSPFSRLQQLHASLPTAGRRRRVTRPRNLTFRQPLTHTRLATLLYASILHSMITEQTGWLPIKHKNQFGLKYIAILFNFTIKVLSFFIWNWNINLNDEVFGFLSNFINC